MSARGLGAITGAIIGLILCIVIFKICNKNNKVKSEYDERQEAIRGRGFKYGFYTALAYFAILTLLPITELNMKVDNSVLGFCGILISVLVLAVYTIWNDAYWGINNNRMRYLIVFALATVINIAVGIGACVTGNMIQDGVVQAPAINLLCGVLFLVIAITLVIKMVAKREEE